MIQASITLCVSGVTYSVLSVMILCRMANDLMSLNVLLLVIGSAFVVHYTYTLVVFPIQFYQKKSYISICSNRCAPMCQSILSCIFMAFC